MQKSVSKYDVSDKSMIEKLGKNLHDNYEFLLDEFSDCMVIRDDGNVIGFIIYSVIYERVEIIDIYVDKKYRRDRVGSILLSEVIKKAKEKKCDNITLEVSMENKVAIKFYEKFGFKIEAKRKGYYKEIDAYLMRLNLR